MNKKYHIPIIIFLSIATGFLLGRLVYRSNNIFYTQNRDFKKLEKLINIIEEYYPDKFDIFDYLRNSLIRKIRTYDPYFAAYDDDSYKDFSNEISGEYTGFGIQYYVFDDTAYITAVFDNSPAKSLGLKKLDQIIAVNDSNICKLSIDSISSLFDKTTKAKLTIMSFFADSIKYIFINKQKIQINPVRYLYVGNNTAYININEFTENADKYFDEAAKELTTHYYINNVILDLRDNPGGLLTAAVNIADDFFDSNKVITYTETKKGTKKTYLSTNKGRFKNVNLIVLVNMQTASASELVSLAFQDNDRALIIGDRTYGKGVFQQDFAPISNDFYHITTGKYFGPSGRNINSNRFAENDSSETFRTTKGRLVKSNNGITPEINCSFWAWITTDQIALSFLKSHKQLFDTVRTISTLEKISENFLDTSKASIECLSMPPKEMLTYSLASLLLPDTSSLRYLIENDSCFLRAKGIIDSNKIQDYIFEKDSIL